MNEVADHFVRGDEREDFVAMIEKVAERVEDLCLGDAERLGDLQDRLAAPVQCDHVALGNPQPVNDGLASAYSIKASNMGVARLDRLGHPFVPGVMEMIPAPLFTSAECAIGFYWPSVFQAEFLEQLRPEKIELKLGQRLRRERLNVFLDFGSQGAELRLQEPQRRPSLALLNATFVGGFHEWFDLLVRFRLHQRLHPILLGFVQFSVRFQAFCQEELPKVIFLRLGNPFQPFCVQFGLPVGRQPHERAQRHAQQVLTRRVLLSFQGRQSDVGVLEPDDPLFPEMLQPVDLAELEPLSPFGEEADEKGLEKLLEQHLETLIVIGNAGLRHDDRLPVVVLSQRTRRARPDQQQSTVRQCRRTGAPSPPAVEIPTRPSLRNQPDEAHAKAQRRKEGTQAIRSRCSQSSRWIYGLPRLRPLRVWASRFASVLLRTWPETIVAFRSAKVLSFAERKATFREVISGQILGAFAALRELIGLPKPVVGRARTASEPAPAAPIGISSQRRRSSDLLIFDVFLNVFPVEEPALFRELAS